MVTKTYKSTLADRLNELIDRESNLTPASLARKLGIPTNKITRILNGDVTDPKASTLLQIAHCFGITIEQLLGTAPLTRQGEYGELSSSKLLPVFAMQHLQEQQPTTWYRWVENEVEGNYFALQVDTDLYEPTFPQGSLLIINPDFAPADRSFIIVRQRGHCTIKKYVIDGGEAYLYPINPKLPIEKYDEKSYNMLGVILEVHQRLRSS